MAGISRRRFLIRSSAGAAGIGLLATSPGLISGLASRVEAAREQEIEAVMMGDEVVAHVRDLHSGEIRLFVGDREVVHYNPDLAIQLIKASK